MQKFIFREILQNNLYKPTLQLKQSEYVEAGKNKKLAIDSKIIDQHLTIQLNQSLVHQQIIKQKWQ